MPVHSPAVSFGRNDCLLLGRAWRLNASSTPEVSIGARQNAMFALFHISCTAVETSVRQALPAVFRIAGEAVPAGVDELAVRLGVALGRGDFAVREPRALAVADAVERIEHVACEARRRFEHRVDELRRHLVQAGSASHLLQPRELAQDEVHVFERRGVGGHAAAPLLLTASLEDDSSFVSSGTALKRSSTSQ